MELTKMTTDELYKIIYTVKAALKQKEEEKMRAAVDSHIGLVGKCYKELVSPQNGLFPDMWQYYKIISERANNQYWVSALTFEQYPLYWFDYFSSKAGQPGDYYFGTYDFEGIRIIELPFFCNGKEEYYQNDFIEISEEEYNEAMNDYVRRLQKMSWPADHNRTSTIIPGESGWDKN